nr:unnamed protein product [Digitaria exilis]CAB3455576.1 unnamed protein product [Digitaria exilis]
MAMILKEQCLHTDITLEQLEEIMLPKAIDFFRQNAEAMVHQMLWKSEHGREAMHEHTEIKHENTENFWES